MSQYCISKYALNDIANPQHLSKKVTEAFNSFDQSNHYLLYSNSDLKSFDDMSREEVRVDDLTIIKLYE